MKLVDVVNKLRASGAKVSYRKRTDGSIVIKSINGVKYNAREGNVLARAMVGEQQSAAAYEQRVKAADRSNFFVPKAHRKKTRGLTKAQRSFIAKYNRQVDRINAIFKPKRKIPKIGSKIARAAMSRGMSFEEWQEKAIRQAVLRGADIPMGENQGFAEREALAAFILANYKGNHQATEVAHYIVENPVTQDYLDRLHDLAYRKDDARLKWDTAFKQAEKSTSIAKSQLEEIKLAFQGINLARKSRKSRKPRIPKTPKPKTSELVFDGVHYVRRKK